MADSIGSGPKPLELLFHNIPVGWPVCRLLYNIFRNHILPATSAVNQRNPERFPERGPDLHAERHLYVVSVHGSSQSAFENKVICLIRLIDSSHSPLVFNFYRITRLLRLAFVTCPNSTVHSTSKAFYSPSKLDSIPKSKWFIEGYEDFSIRVRFCAPQKDSPVSRALGIHKSASILIHYETLCEFSVENLFELLYSGWFARLCLSIFNHKQSIPVKTGYSEYIFRSLHSPLNLER